MENESDAAVIAASFDDPGRFGAIFDRHATVVFRYLVRRVGVNDAEPLLGDVFRVAFEKRESYDCERANARPWPKRLPRSPKASVLPCCSTCGRSSATRRSPARSTCPSVPFVRD